MPIIIGTKRADNLSGSVSGDLIVSGNGADTIDAAGGNDIVEAGNGADTVFGGDGNDTVFGGNGDDIVDGGIGNDLISGGRGDDDIDGGEGDDIVLGGRGNDRLTGALGNDYLNGGKGIDTAVYFGDIRNYSFSFERKWLEITDTANGDTDTVVKVEILEFENATIYLDGRNNGPIADDVVAAVHEDGPAVGGNLLTDADAFDFDGDALSISAVEGSASNLGTQIVLASGALLTVLADGTYSYDPNGQFEDLNDGDTGSDSATFTISDGNDAVTRTVTFEIEGETDNFAPVARDVLYEIPEGGPFPPLAFDVTDENPGALTYTSPGMLTPPIAIPFPNAVTDFVNTNDGSVFYVLGNDWEAAPEGGMKEYAFTYTATDAFGLTSNEATFTVRVLGENDAPQRPFGIIFLRFASEDSGLLTDSYGILDPDSDDDLTTLDITFSTTIGNPVNNGDGTYSIDTDAFDYLGEGQQTLITFTATDRHGASQSFSNFAILGANDDPDAVDDSFIVDADITLSGDLFADNGLGADSDIDDGDTFQVAAINGVALDGGPVDLDFGTLTINPDGTFDYVVDEAIQRTLAIGDTQEEIFTYDIADGAFTPGTDTATVTIVIEGVANVATGGTGTGIGIPIGLLDV